MTAAAREPARQPVEIKIDHRRRVEGEPLGAQQAADDGDAERMAQFRSRALAEASGKPPPITYADTFPAGRNGDMKSVRDG